jgi:hypothetical protein
VVRLALFALLLVLTAGCTRKAPGPEECRTFALLMFGFRSEEELEVGSPQTRALRPEVDGLTRECLVMPYDRELLRCALQSGGARACKLAFDRRRSSGSEPMLSR